MRSVMIVMGIVELLSYISSFLAPGRIWCLAHECIVGRLDERSAFPLWFRCGVRLRRLPSWLFRPRLPLLLTTPESVSVERHRAIEPSPLGSCLPALPRLALGDA